jgi:succinate dehydrogenase hydrophobic anchor subunit
MLNHVCLNLIIVKYHAQNGYRSIQTYYVITFESKSLSLSFMLRFVSQTTPYIGQAVHDE